MRSARAVLATLVVGTALVAVPGAAARTLRLNWTERATAEFGYLPMTFEVRSVVLARRAWAVRASVTNRSGRSIRIIGPVTA